MESQQCFFRGSSVQGLRCVDIFFFRNSLTLEFLEGDLEQMGGAHRRIGSGKTRVMIWAESTYA